MFRRLRTLVQHMVEPAAAPPRPRSSRPEPPPMDPITATLAYHERTKHHPQRYARALPYLDWDTQPDPFRVYEGAPQVPLALSPAEDSPRYEPAFLRGGLPVAPLNLASVSRLLQDSLGLSAWKQAEGARWALRMNPSSGNLHPTEAYLVAGPIPDLSEAPAVWHYSPRSHALERRLDLPGDLWATLCEGLPAGAILVGLSSILLRESWKYGERSFRYCQHDLGHALGALAVAAAGLGWDLRLLDGALDGDLAALLGAHTQQGPEAETVEALVVISPADAGWSEAAWRGWRLPSTAALRGARWTGTPRPLAQDHHPWPVVDAVAEATRLVASLPEAAWLIDRSINTALEIGDSPLLLRRILHQRRSAVDMDGRTGITAGAFYQILCKLLAGRDQVPFAALPWAPRVHLAIWVHRVAGVPPGLYLLVRAPEAEAALRAGLKAEFLWTRPEGCPDGLPLWTLRLDDLRGVASGASCGQALAGDGCFAVAMLTDLGPAVRAFGAAFYRRLHWEAGMVGQMLYLEAEASGVRGTGIGCFYDDMTHQHLGTSEGWSVIYHFAVGGPVEDGRLQTLPPYGR